MRLEKGGVAAAQILQDSMIDAVRIFLKDVPIVVDVSVADNWYQK